MLFSVNMFLSISFQEPTALEVIVSEDAIDPRLREWTRQTLTVLPETGCGVDNLETTKKEVEVESYNLWRDEHETTQQALYRDGAAWRLETIFGWIPNHRVCMSVGLTDQGGKLDLKSPVVVTLERQTHSESSAGSRADGGGLDGRSVSEWMGNVLRKSHSFATETPKNFRFSSDDKLSRISYPRNLTLSCGWIDEDKLVVEMGQVWQDEKVHHVVKRTFSSIADFSIESAKIAVEIVD